MVILVKSLLKWQDDRHVINEFSDPFNPTLSPCPYLRADVVQDWNIQSFSMAGDVKVKIRKINEDEDIGS